MLVSFTSCFCTLMFIWNNNCFKSLLHLLEYHLQLFGFSNKHFFTLFLKSAHPEAKHWQVFLYVWIMLTWLWSGLNNYLTVASPCQTLDICSECSQIIQLSTNMISSRDTKVRMLAIHSLRSFILLSLRFTVLYFMELETGSHTQQLRSLLIS